MRNIYIFIVLVSTLLMAACTGKGTYRQKELAYVDSVAENNAQKADSVLKVIAKDISSAPKSERMYYNLMRIKVDDYMFVSHTEDSLAMALVAYYENDGDKHLLPQAYYYAGKVYKSLNDTPQAMDYFQKAMELVEGSGTMLESQVYSQLGYIFSMQWLDDEALSMFQKSLKCSEVIKDTVGMIYSLGDIGQVYKDKDELNKAIKYHNEALILAKETNNQRLYIGTIVQLASLYRLQKQYDKAREYLQPALEYKGAGNRSSILAVAARIYMNTNKVDSAFICYEKLLEEGNIYAKKEAYEITAEYYMKKGKTDKALDFLKLYNLYIDSIQSITTTEVVQQKKSLYSYKMREKENTRLKEENVAKKQLIDILLIISIAAVTIAIALFLYIKEKKKTYKYKLAIYTQPIGKSKGKGNIEDTEIYKEIQRTINNPKAKLKLSDSDWNRLSTAVNETYPDFDKKLSDLCKMSMQDYHVCLLLKIKIPLSTIAEFASLTKSGVTSIRTKLYKRAFNMQGSASSWDEIILSL